MDEVKDLFHDVEEALRSLQKIQQMYDSDMWEIQSPSFSKLRHVLVHLCATLGKVASIVEPMDHDAHRGLDTFNVEELRSALGPYLADLLIFTLQLANLAEGDIGAMLRMRYKRNGTRFAPGSDFADL